ncbi:uncharacterized protein MELLADRAFT_53475 [Melampsora larici-populina 98AG31]|uniref:Uncharacterized protein n=1 Tax=Melampsora larici-populina (strain 98AG31 / pathotype 3-4-7) TaxID=747676 RepID=F4S000_MELLP|nr:uncharacterized protein MELLADRAFT_53475 [Melampsora larici-populina 98AG31]EGG02099.1 hypothetical protein MELLADRAFT_53475 [Melampsora larici-populina 98AG31]
MSFQYLISPVLPPRVCRLCKSPTNLLKSIQKPLQIGIKHSIGKSTNFDLSQYTSSFSTINTSAQVTSSSNSSIKPSSIGILDSNHHIGFATILTRPSSTDEDYDEIHEKLSSTEAEEGKLDQNPSILLRLAVECGECHGFQYKMNFPDVIDSDDESV